MSVGNCGMINALRCVLITLVLILAFLSEQSKRDTLMVNIKWYELTYYLVAKFSGYILTMDFTFRYYRPCEVPETVYQLLVQDRNTEQGGDPMLIDCNDKTDKIDGWLTGNKISFLHDPVIKGRELFISDATDTYPVSLLRYCFLF